MKMLIRALLALSLLASGVHAAVDLTAKPASGSFTFNSSWTGANGAVEPTTYYHIDEGSGTTLNDLGAENADGTITGADWVTDGSAAALDFVSANSDYVTNLAAWGIANTSSDWTAAVLISIDSGAANDTYFSLGDTTLAQTHGSQVFMSGGIGASTHVVNNRYHGGTTQSDTGGSYTATTWQMMWFRWTASTRTLKVFTDNGTEDTGIALVVTSGEQVPDSTDGRIGAQATTNISNPSDARIAGVYIWKSTALTAAQMQDVCNWNGTQCEPWPFLTPSGSCPATCAGGRSARCITDISDASDPDNILYGLSPAAVANEDTVCYDPSSTLTHTVSVSAAGWPSIASGGSQLTDSFDYCVMDNGDPCGTDGKYEVTFTPVITSVTGIGTGQTTGTVTVTPAGPTEGTVRGVAISKTSYDTYGAPSHAQIAAGVDGNNANVAWGSEFTKSFLSTVSPGWTFGRASSQTYEKSDGTLGTVTSGNPAFTYSGGTAQGVLLEGARTNLIPYSTGFSQSAWEKVQLTQGGSVTAPDGNTSTVSELTIASWVSYAYIREASLPVSASTTYTVSWWAKRGTATNAKYRIYDVSNGANITGDTTYYSETSSSWVRISKTFTTPAGCTSIHIYPYTRTSATNGETFYVWGAQLEAGAFASSYIPTTSGAATRNATSLTRSWNFPSNNFSGQIKVRAGTASGTSTGGAYQLLSASDGTNNNRIYIYVNTAGTGIYIGKVVGGTNVEALLSSSWTTGLLDIRFRYDTTGFYGWFNGGAKVSTTSGVAPTSFSTIPTLVSPCGISTGATVGACAVESLTIWNEAKSDAFLEALE